MITAFIAFTTVAFFVALAAQVAEAVATTTTTVAA